MASAKQPAIWLPGALFSQGLHLICPDVFDASVASKWRRLGTAAYWMVFMLGMAWLKLVSENVPELYLVGRHGIVGDAELTSIRMKSFMFLKHNSIAKLNLITGIRNLRPHQDCMPVFLSLFDRDKADGVQVHFRRHTCESPLERMYSLRSPSFQHHHAAPHYDHRSLMPIPHSETTNRKSQLCRLDTHRRQHRVIPTTLFLFWSLLHRPLLDAACSHCI